MLFLHSRLHWTIKKKRTKKLIVNEIYRSSVMNLFKVGTRFFGVPRISYSLRLARTLFSESTLGVLSYEKIRQQFSDNKFDTKRLEYNLRSHDLKVLVGATKQLLHVIDSTADDIHLLKACLYKIYSTETASELFNFGPLVMRMFHYFNLHNEAIEFYNDDELRVAFDQFVCHHILLDLLFKNGKYEQLLQILDGKHREQQSKGLGTSKNIYALAFAACYKLNTPEKFDYAQKLWNELNQSHQLTQTRNFFAALALHQEKPSLALEVLPDVDKHFATLQIRLLALVRLKKIDQIFNILKTTNSRNRKISQEVIDKIQNEVDKIGTSDNQNEFNDIAKDLKENKQLMPATVDDILCWPFPANLFYSAGNNYNNIKKLENK